MKFSTYSKYYIEPVKDNNKESILKANRNRGSITYKGTTIGLTSNLSLVTSRCQEIMNDSFKVLREETKSKTKT